MKRVEVRIDQQRHAAELKWIPLREVAMLERPRDHRLVRIKILSDVTVVERAPEEQDRREENQRGQSQREMQRPPWGAGQEIS